MWGLSPVLKVGDLYNPPVLPPCSDTYVNRLIWLEKVLLKKFLKTQPTSCAGGRHNMPLPLQVDLLTLKVVSESRVMWATSVPILVFLGLSVLDLGPMYATDVRRASFYGGRGVISSRSVLYHSLTVVKVTWFTWLPVGWGVA